MTCLCIWNSKYSKVPFRAPFRTEESDATPIKPGRPVNYVPVQSIVVLARDPPIFQISTNDLQIPGARRATWSKLHVGATSTDNCSQKQLLISGLYDRASWHCMTVHRDRLYDRASWQIVWPCIVTDSLWIKPTDAQSSNFWRDNVFGFVG